MRARVTKDDGTPVVFYTLGEYACRIGSVMSYMHVGQHGEAAVEWMRRECRMPQTTEERAACAALLREVGASEKLIAKLTGGKHGTM